ncbi:MAG: hypothetical protein HYX53_12755 [Chloroflexi bacterium]|nr:hypothetical protein [Chloroflexota bacterium]
MALPAMMIFASCGGTSSLPAAPPCPAATATPPGPRNADFRYQQTVMSGVTALANLTSEFRGRWPDGKFSSDPNFRTEFVTYAGNATCLASRLRTMTPQPASHVMDFKQRFDAALGAYLGAFDGGLKAIQRRNVSEYRTFNKDLDAAAQALNEVVLTLNR